MERYHTVTPSLAELERTVDAVFFDCDGVLLDSVYVKEQQFRRLIEERLPHHLDAAMDYFWRNGGTSRLEKFRWIWRNLAGVPLSELEVEELGRQFADKVFQGVVGCPMIAGAAEFLSRYCPTLPCHVISGTPEVELKRILDARNLSRFFRGVHGSPDDKTTIGTRLIANDGYAASKVWFIGDALTDRDAARRLQVRFVGIDGPHLTPFLHGSELLIRDLKELPAVLQSGAD